MSEQTSRTASPPPRRGGPMGHGPMVGAPVAKARDFKKTIGQLWDYLKEYQTRIVAAILFSVFSTVFSIYGPKLLGMVTQKLADGFMAYYGGGELLIDFATMGRIVVVLLVLYLLSVGCSLAQSLLMSRVSMNVTYRLRRDISEKMNRIPLNYYDTTTHGEVLSRITNDVDTVSQTLNQSVTQLISMGTMIVGVLVMMLSISWLMTLAALVVIPVSLGVMMLAVKRSQGFFTAQQKSIGEINGLVEENYGGHNVVQAFGGEKDALEKFSKTNGELYGSAWKSQFISGIMIPVMQFVGNAGYVLVAILGGWLAVNRVVDVGDIQAFIQYMRQFTQPVGQLAQISNTLQSTVAAAERVFEFLGEEEEAPDPEENFDEREVAGTVEFVHVGFGYNPEKIIIRDFSAFVEAGSKIAVVGPTGAGKTTIVKLLMRFYDIQQGKILVDGVDIFKYSRDRLRSRFGMVLQETWLYNASIMDNIRYGTFDATDDEVIAAAKAAHCDEFIRTLPGGYNMILNEEAGNISQGQKQLFTIARVILADPSILILDEATSSVDTRTELLIQSAMDNLMKNRTSFVIAHRLSTIRNADMILVLNDGDIVEQGSHERLLAAGGFYAELYNSQFETGDDTAS